MQKEEIHAQRENMQRFTTTEINSVPVDPIQKMGASNVSLQSGLATQIQNPLNFVK